MAKNNVPDSGMKKIVEEIANKRNQKEKNDCRLPDSGFTRIIPLPKKEEPIK